MCCTGLEFEGQQSDDLTDNGERHFEYQTTVTKRAVLLEAVVVAVRPQSM